MGEQTGLPVSVVRGQPRELAPDERLALYRTAQEALTNVRCHAAAERVRVKLEYGLKDTVLVVEDHAVAGVPAPVGLGLAGNGYGLTECASGPSCSVESCWPSRRPTASGSN